MKLRLQNIPVGSDTRKLAAGPLLNLVEGLPFDADPAAEVTARRYARIHRDGDPPDDVWEGLIVWRTCGDIPCGRQTDGTCDYVPCGETSR